MENFFSFAEDLYVSINDFLGRYNNSLCCLESVVDDEIAVAKNMSLVTIIRVDGVLKHVGEEEFKRVVHEISMELSHRIGSGGHMIHQLFGFDPDLFIEELTEMDRAMIQSAENMGMDGASVRAFLQDWRKSIARWCAKEFNYMALWTSPMILSPVSRKIMRRNMVQDMLKAPVGKTLFAQRLNWTPKEILDTHRSFYQTMVLNLRAIGLQTEVLPVRQWLHDYRRMIDPEATGPECYPRLKWDRLPVQFPDRFTSEMDYQDFLYPNIGNFLFPRETQDIANNIVRIGDTWHGSFVMGLGPREVQPFAVLFRILKEMNFPWRCSFMFGPQGLDAVSWKRMITSIFHFPALFHQNARFNDAYEYLRKLELEGDVVCRFKAVFSTCVRNQPDPLRAREQLVRQMHDLASAVQSWGGIETDMVVGNPVLALASSLPGVTQDIPSKPCAAPMLDEDTTPVKMLPITRPTSVWRRGSVLFRTPDGKLFPYAHMSSQQASWIDLGVAPMGQGKSVLLNTLNLAFCLQGGLNELPMLSITDIGPSSSGLINLLQAFLPPSKRHLAIYKRLRMEDAINPFDLPLGYRKPFPMHKSFLVNFLSLLATELNADAPQDGIVGIARTCVDIAYDDFSDRKNPKRYIRGIDKEVDDLVDALNLTVDEQTSWWEIVDTFFDQGYYREAAIAQRYAVPLLSEVAAVAKRDIVTGVYKHKTRNGEPITDFFWRSIIDAIGSYPILARPTSVDFSNARVISVDLDEVAPRGSPEADRQTGVMYMLARYICANRIFLMPDDVKFAPERYWDYHRKRIEDIRSIPKRLSFDEVHRMKRSSAISKQILSDVETVVRESRKWNISIGMYTQDISDIPDVLVELSTSIYILGVNTPAKAREIVDMLGLPESMFRSLQRMGKPDYRGANFVGVFRTAYGTISHLLTNTVGKMALWAFSTTSEDMTVRNRLYDLIGVEKTLAALTRFYPSGVKAEIERRRVEFRRKAALDDDADESIFDEVIREIMDEIRKLESRGLELGFEQEV